MKRFIVIPALITLIVLVGAIALSTQVSTNALRPVPTVEARLMPGNPIPQGVSCYPDNPDGSHFYRFCELGDNQSILTNGSVIKHAYVYTESSGLTVGDVLAAWGRPDAANYTDYSTTVFWESGNFIYVMSGGKFTPFSRVGFVAYGKALGKANTWRGFR